MVTAILIAIFIGIPIGIISALRPVLEARLRADRPLTLASSRPTFVLGLGRDLHLRGLARISLPTAGMQTLGKPDPIVDF